MKGLLKTALFAGGAMVALKALDSRLEITNYAVESAYLPEKFDGFKIVHLSDYHNDSVPELITEVRNEEPDLIVCTGDMADDKGTYIPALRLIENLQKIAPCIMVTGNHDLWRADWQELESKILKTGVRILRNERVFINRDGEKIAISGIDDPYVSSNGKIKEYVRESAESLGQYEGYDILLFHRANLLDELADSGFDLVLSGHMHGGHMRIPGIGGVAAPRTSWAGGENILFPKYFGGRFEAGDTTMIVNRGLGNPTPIPRVFNRPEMIVIRLSCAK